MSIIDKKIDSWLEKILTNNQTFFYMTVCSDTYKECFAIDALNHFIESTGYYVTLAKLSRCIKSMAGKYGFTFERSMSMHYSKNKAMRIYRLLK